MGRMIRNDETGALYEYVDGHWTRRYSEPVSSMQAGVISLGGAMTNLGRGVSDLIYPGSVNPEVVAGERQTLGELRREHPVATAVGGALPGVAAGIASGVATGGASIPALMAVEGAVGGGMAGLDYEPTMAERGLNLLAGGVMGGVGAAGGAFAARALSNARRFRDAAQLKAGKIRGELDAAPTLAERANAAWRTGGGMSDAEAATPLDGTAEFQRLINRVEGMGYQLTPGDRAQSDMYKMLEVGAERHPLTTGLFQPMRDRNRGIIVDQAKRAIGEPVGLAPANGRLELGPDDFGRANERIGGQFRAIGRELDDALEGQRVDTTTGEIVAAPPLEMDGELGAGLARIGRAAGGSYRQGEVTGFINDFRGMLSGAQARGLPGGLTGSNVMEFRTAVNNAMRDLSATPGKGTASALLRDLLGEVDGWIERAVPEEMAQRWITARDQWRMLQVLEAPGVVNGWGQVNIKTLARRLESEYPAEYKRGGDLLMNEGALRARYGAGRVRQVPQATRDLFDVARAGVRFGDIVGNSGTPTGMAFQQMIDDPGRGALVMTVQGIERMIGRALTRAERTSVAAIRARREAGRRAIMPGAAIGGAVAPQVARDNRAQVVERE